MRSMQRQTIITGLRSRPIPVISIPISSRSCSVKVSGGTTPVPVNSTAPWGKDLAAEKKAGQLLETRA